MKELHYLYIKVFIILWKENILLINFFPAGLSFPFLLNIYIWIRIYFNKSVLRNQYVTQNFSQINNQNK